MSKTLKFPSDLWGYKQHEDSPNFFTKNLARYRRHDHGGGEDGDGWLSSEEINEDFNYGKKRFQQNLDNANKTLKKHGFLPNAYFDLGEKGHFDIVIELTLDPELESKLNNFNKREWLNSKNRELVAKKLESVLNINKIKKNAKNYFTSSASGISVKTYDHNDNQISVSVEASSFVCRLTVRIKEGDVIGFYNSNGAANGSEADVYFPRTGKGFTSLEKDVYGAFKALLSQPTVSWMKRKYPEY